MDAPAQVFTLSDGRQLIYFEWGNPNSPAVFHFHGFPSSGIEAVLLSGTEISAKARIIAPTRPGMGFSTMDPNRTLISWAKDILELAAHLKITQFRLLGVSGGGPYVLACAKVIPREQLLGAAIVSGLYPRSLGTQGMLAGSRVLLSMGAWWMSGLAGRLLDLGLGAAARNRDPKVLNDAFTKAMADRPSTDVKCLEQEKVKAALVESLRDAFRISGAGVGLETGLLGSSWGFELEDIDFEGLTLWHGVLDVNAPFRMAELAASKLKGSVLKRFDAESHLSLLVNHADEILQDLLEGSGRT